MPDDTLPLCLRLSNRETRTECRGHPPESAESASDRQLSDPADSGVDVAASDHDLAARIRAKLPAVVHGSSSDSEPPDPWRDYPRGW